MMMGERRKKNAVLPFAIDRLASASLTCQVYEGFCTAIADGTYPVGAVLPTREVVARELGVGECTVRAALERLVADGVIVSRPRTGCTVRDAPVCRIKGDILIVTTERSGAYSWFVLQDVLQSELVRAGYRVSTVFYVQGGKNAADEKALLAALAENPAFVIIHSCVPRLKQVARIVARSGCKYAAVSMVSPRIGNCVAAVYPDFSSALDAFVSHCVRARICSVCQIDFGGDSIMNPASRLELQGINVERISVRLGDVFADLDAIQSAAAELMVRRIRLGALPDLFFFSDDFLARGALPVLLENGIRVPGDVSVVTHTNCGFAPAFPRSLTRIEVDVSAFARKLSEGVVSYLSGGGFPRQAETNAAFVVGDTLRPR